MLRPMMESMNAIVHTAGGYGPPGGGGYPPGGGYGGPPPMGGGPPPGGFGGPPGAPPGGGYGVPPGGMGAPGGFGAPPPGFPPQGMGPAGDVNTTLTMILSIVTLACCCTPLGIFALVNVMNANNAKKMGDLATAQAKNKTALTMSIIGMVGGLIAWTAVIILQLANAR